MTEKQYDYIIDLINELSSLYDEYCEGDCTKCIAKKNCWSFNSEGNRNIMKRMVVKK